MSYVNVNMWREIARKAANKKILETETEAIEIPVETGLPFPLDENGEPIVPVEYLKQPEIVVETPVEAEQPVAVEETTVAEVETEKVAEPTIVADEPVVVTETVAEETPKKRGRKSKAVEVTDAE